MNLKQAFIENDSIRLKLSASDWKEAIKLSIDPLIESGAVDAEYYDAIIESYRGIWSVLHSYAGYGDASCSSRSRRKT